MLTEGVGRSKRAEGCTAGVVTETKEHDVTNGGCREGSTGLSKNGGDIITGLKFDSNRMDPLINIHEL